MQYVRRRYEEDGNGYFEEVAELKVYKVPKVYKVIGLFFLYKLSTL